MVRIATYPIVKMRTNGTVSLQSHPGISESYYNIYTGKNPTYAQAKIKLFAR